MKRKQQKRPAKIAPPKYPKAIRETSTPRCAMQAKISESRIDERKNSQEGKYKEQELGRARATY